jgi:hypothetical protein
MTWLNVSGFLRYVTLRWMWNNKMTMSNDFESTWTEAVVAYFKALSRHFPGGMQDPWKTGRLPITKQKCLSTTVRSMAPFTEEGVSKSFRTESITTYTLTKINTRWEAIQRVMAAKLTRLTHQIAIQLHLVAESCNICSSRSRRPVRELLDTPLDQAFTASLVSCGL